MITTRLYGGLGNQMFQYAVARAYQLRTGIPFVVDTKFIYSPRRYELSNLSCSPEKRSAWQRLKRTIPVDERITTPEKFNTLELDNLELIGYWQDEKYFKEYEEVIRKDFALGIQMNEVSTKKLKEISSSRNPVSIHIRHGDYIGNAVHPVLTDQYYKSAMEYIGSEVKDPHYFIFSDDPRYWVNDADHGFFDLELMKACKHHIIANSSFSWWGAWLGTNPDQIVVCPETWFADGSSIGIPEKWVRL